MSSPPPCKVCDMFFMLTTSVTIYTYKVTAMCLLTPTYKYLGPFYIFYHPPSRFTSCSSCHPHTKVHDRIFPVAYGIIILYPPTTFVTCFSFHLRTKVYGTTVLSSNGLKCTSSTRFEACFSCHLRTKKFVSLFSCYQSGFNFFTLIQGLRHVFHVACRY